MQPFGVFMGVLMGASLFMEWEAVIKGLGSGRVNEFLGFEFTFYFRFLGLRLDFIPFILTSIFFVAIVLAKKAAWKIIALLAAIFCFGIGVWNLLFFHTDPNLRADWGLWIFTAASLLAAVSALSLLLGKGQSRPDSSSMPPSIES
jgi:hypothetical protein